MSTKDIIFGWQIGSQIMNLQMTKKYIDIPVEPIVSMYFYGTPSNGVKYNGVELPDIETAWIAFAEANDMTSEQAKKIVPYAVVGYHKTDAAYRLTLYDYPLYADGDIYYAANEAGAAVFDVDGDTWKLIGSAAIGGLAVADKESLTWTNHDILNADGSIAVASTEPVYSGDIGLRVGDTVTYYDGVVLPDINCLWDKKTYPYAAIMSAFGMSYFVCSADKWYVADWTTTDGECECYMLLETQELVDIIKEDEAFADMDIEPNKWFYLEKSDGFTLMLGTTWISHDVLREDGTVWAKATEPIPVGRLIGSSYNGTILPDIESVWTEEVKETYPYAVLIDETDDGGDIDFMLMPVPLETVEIVTVRFYTVVDGGFGDAEESDTIPAFVHPNSGIGDVNFVWTSHDILTGAFDNDTGEFTPDGATYLAASEPVPIYDTLHN